ncbi:DUF3644 domain-containing protein [Lactococcus garvieae]|uniref:DUF3644 domain-containing protein n=1 Tax=Lactococcus petauri TaxID=1940789 RepID=UPI0018AAA6B2|nr:DUF3644 domain-containing protein [Lactococcus petauri]MDC0809351.1 DUF3644 domain-containing protein [Lactococcus petauri]MDC0814043.1 DUF3644 domain-containing protein [Lactococcus petauri]QQC73709.1 DUF3644 domain-containing protein [Lactococcus garvieae]
MAKEELSEKLVEKSIEAFIMGLEVYNKPTIKYRIEGFSYFIINAWELMLKAELLNRGQSIYYKGSSRTLSFNDVVERIYTDKKQPLRLNLEKIIELRNTSTHFITEEYETIYAPFFQANVGSFAIQINRFHGIDITKHIAQNFLTLSVNVNRLSTEEVRAKYTSEMAEKLITAQDDSDFLMKSNPSNDLFIPLRHDFFITKNKKEADLLVGVDNKAEAKIKIVRQLQDPNDKYKLTYNNVIKAVNKQLKSKQIPFEYKTSKGVNEFSQHALKTFIQFYDIKRDEKFAFCFAGAYRYSQQLVDFIIEEIEKDEKIISRLLR